jgi:AAA+ ATPase superfamily predicted ATPase
MGIRLEQQLTEQLYTMIYNVMKCCSFDIENTTILDHDTYVNDEQDDEYSDDSSNIDSKDPSFGENQEEIPEKINLQKFSLKYMLKVMDFYDEIDMATVRRKHNFSSVQHRFRRVRNSSYLANFRSYINQHGTKYKKLEEIDQFVFHMFEAACEKLLPVHDSDLVRWVLQRARASSITNFVASHHWLVNFKQKHNIVSRKITKIMTKHAVESAKEIDKSVNQLVYEV